MDAGDDRGHAQGMDSPFTPRRWWTGPLDVERLAVGSVAEAVDAVRDLAEARGCRVPVETSPALVAASFDAIGHLRVDGRAATGWAPLSGFFRTSDGWVRTHANYPHHRLALQRALGLPADPADGDGEADAARLREALRGWTARDVEAAVTAAGGIAVVARTPDEWAAHPQAKATASEPWVHTEAVGERPAPGRVASREDCRPLLAGVRVLDLTRVIAGPSCTQLLACLGADVLRVDPPARPELEDQYLSTGMGKRSAVADLGARGDALEDMLAVADVVVLGYRPGSVDRFGLAPERLRERFPRTVVATLSAWGVHGPWGRRAGFDSIVQAASGIAALCADPREDDGRPGALPVQALDHATGYRMAAGVLSLLARGRSGTVTASLLGAARTLMSLPAPPELEPGVLPVPLAETAWQHGRLTAVPPPVTVDGRTLERPVGAYGGSPLAW